MIICSLLLYFQKLVAASEPVPGSLHVAGPAFASMSEGQFVD